MKKSIKTQINIKSSPETVWKVLTDFDKYPEWNPFIKSIKGELKVGYRLTTKMHPPGSKEMTFKPTVKVVRKNKEFRWLGQLFIPGLFDGEHIFELSSADGKATLFTQRENFNGILVGLKAFQKIIDVNTIQGFEEFNQALKVRCESQNY